MARMMRLPVIFALSLLLVNCPSAPKPPENTVAAPTFSPAEGSYTGTQTVTIATTTEGAQIRYTTDSSMPSSTSGTVYAEPVQVSATTTLRAIAYKTGWNDSPVAAPPLRSAAPRRPPVSGYRRPGRPAGRCRHGRGSHRRAQRPCPRKGGGRRLL